MKYDVLLPVSTPTSSSLSSSSILARRRYYKFWALAAILLLAFWSMLTGTVTLRLSAGDLKIRFHDDFTSTQDLDVLDMEEREKLVWYMWDVYTNNQRARLGGFWQQAFVAAYEDLSSDVPQLREAAVSEIADMSSRYLTLDPPPLHSCLSLSLQNFHINQGENRALTSTAANL